MFGTSSLLTALSEENTHNGNQVAQGQKCRRHQNRRKDRFSHEESSPDYVEFTYKTCKERQPRNTQRCQSEAGAGYRHTFCQAAHGAYLRQP